MVQCLIWDSLNSSVYRDYLKDHFIKFIRRREPHEYLLLIVDGHKSHISVDLIDWAKEQKIILFVLPAHTSHILQLLDVASFGLVLSKRYIITNVKS